jgi:hypothetical protein
MKKNLKHPGSGGVSASATVNLEAASTASNLPPLLEDSGGDDGAPPPAPRHQRADPATRWGRQSTGMFAVDVLGGFQQVDGSERASVNENRNTRDLWQVFPPLGGVTQPPWGLLARP